MPPGQRSVSDFEKSGRIIHLIFGLVGGAALGFFASFRSAMDVPEMAIGIAVSAVISGVLAYHFGDRFWHWLGRFGSH